MMIRKKANNIMRKLFKYFLLFFFLGLSFFSCKNEKINPEFIKKLVSIENGLPSPNFNFNLYFKIDNGRILETNIVFIYKIYQDSHSKNDDFDIYLKDLFNQKKTLKIIDIKKYENKGYFFNVSEIDEKVLNMNIGEIEKEFLETEKEFFILKPNKMNYSTVKTVLYKMFIDGYIITLSDYGGGYYSITKFK
ncbi:hypothetical protein [Chryseobacterium sp. MDT2-18]|uniref:hypothetical protein n=1 Tax=Chryseobacterium sp. MDT2-18 TaxID=1259136 RepID=UPI002780CC05|nr:hypothetical protein [Chryseobacterium sp. MDT2-18]MDQ0478283.1 hypothetical protein [Chryseobacterium sp. MDT2-18]